MKRLNRNPGKFETMDLYKAMARQEGYKFSDPDSSRKFIDKLSADFSNAKSNPITVHGLRTQTMFEHIAAALGHCVVIKAEDSGDILVSDDKLRVPDFRVLLQSGQQMLIEVKNFYQKQDPFEAYEVSQNYLEGLQRYASLFGQDLKLAIYWSRWNMWSLVPDTNYCC